MNVQCRMNLAVESGVIAQSDAIFHLRETLVDESDVIVRSHKILVERSKKSAHCRHEIWGGTSLHVSKKYGKKVLGGGNLPWSSDSQ